MRLLVPFGTRPEIVKLTPVVQALRAAGDEVTVVATGQHHDAGLTEVFYAELGVAPDIVLRIEDDRLDRLAGIVGGAVRVVGEVRPDAVLVLGDTHTVPAYCLAARNATIPAVHLEAGLRSFNPTSVEEVNRRVAAVAQLLSAVGLTGPANVQGFLGNAGDIAFTEVNPRFSGGLPLSLAAGADLVGEYLRGVHGEPVRPERLVARPDVTMFRHLVEVFER